MMSEPIRVLVVDDERNMRATLMDILVDEGYQVDAVDSGEAAIEICQENFYNPILMDVRMPGMGGVEAFREISRRNRAARVILMSAYQMEEAMRAADSMSMRCPGEIHMGLTPARVRSRTPTRSPRSYRRRRLPCFFPSVPRASPTSRLLAQPIVGTSHSSPKWEAIPSRRGCASP